MLLIDSHEWLLSEQVDILPRLLLPLAGPEEFDEDDMEKLPVDLQYLEPDKEREPDTKIRCMLVEAVNKVRNYSPFTNAYKFIFMVSFSLLLINFVVCGDRVLGSN